MLESLLAHVGIGLATVALSVMAGCPLLFAQRNERRLREKRDHAPR